MQIKYLLLVSCLGFTAGCGGGSSVSVIENGSTTESGDADNGIETGVDTGTPVGVPETQLSLVTKFAGATFVSIETLEAGGTGAGVGLGNWKVSFTDDVVTWNYSDIIEVGTYSLDSNGSPVANFSGREIVFSGDGVSLVWDSRTYLRLDSSLFDSQQALVDYFDRTTYLSIEELDIGENAFGGMAMGNWSISFDGNELDWHVQDTVQRGTYSYRDGSSFQIDFGGVQSTVYALVGDQLLANSVVYEKDSIGQFDSQQTLVEYLAGSTYQSASLQQVGSVTDGLVAVGNWYLDFSEDTFIWNYADAEEAGTYEYLSESTFAAIFPDRTLTIEIDGVDIIWDGLRYIQQ